MDYGAGTVKDVEKLFQNGTVAGLTDGELLERFVSRRDETAFEALVVRHGPMVRGVCRQWLRDPNDVEDAVQATLLILVRKAASVRVIGSLGPWFYGVAYRVAVRARATASRRRERSGREPPAISQDDDPDRGDSGPMIHEELGRLPERYRAPIVLCYFEGLSHAQAAGQLGCPVGTVRSRLARGRALLRSRLGRRGLTGSFCLTLPRITRGEGFALRVAARSAAVPGATGVVSVPVAELTEGVLMSMLMTKCKAVAAVILAVGVVAASAAALAYEAPSAEHGGAVRSAAAGVAPKEDRTKTFTKTYYVGDLIVPAPGSERGQDPSRLSSLNFLPIIELISSSVAPGTWGLYDGAGGGLVPLSPVVENARPVGSMTPFFLSISLIIRHTPEVHEQVADRLRQLRRLHGGDAAEQPVKVDPAARPAGAGPAADGRTALRAKASRIRKLLDELDREVEGLVRDKTTTGPDGRR